MGGGRATTSGEWRCTRLTNGLSSHTHNAHDACNSRAAAQSSLAFNTKHTTRNINTQNEPTHITRNRERLSSHDRWSRQIFRRAKIGIRSLQQGKMTAALAMALIQVRVQFMIRKERDWQLLY